MISGSHSEQSAADQLEQQSKRLIETDELRKAKQRERTKRYYEKLTDDEKREQSRRKRQRRSEETTRRQREYDAAWHRARRRQIEILKEATYR